MFNEYLEQRLQFIVTLKGVHIYWSLEVSEVNS